MRNLNVMYQTAAREPVSVMIQISTSGNPSGHFITRFISVHHVDPLPQTAAREPVLVRHADKNERNEIMKTSPYTGHFYTTPDLVRPPGAEKEKRNLLDGNFPGSVVTDSQASPPSKGH
jgi:hypothetical protein